MEFFKKLFTGTPKREQEEILEGLDEISRLEDAMRKSRLKRITVYYNFDKYGSKSISLNWEAKDKRGDIEFRDGSLCELIDRAKQHLE